MEVEKVYKILSMMVNVEQIQILFDQYPDKFDYQIRKQFIGARAWTSVCRGPVTGPWAENGSTTLKNWKSSWKIGNHFEKLEANLNFQE